MRTILFGATLFTAMAAAAIGTAGTAAAATPIAQPDESRIGITLSHDETAALAGGPLPALVGMIVPPSRMGAGLRPDTQLHRDENGGIHASLRQVIMEAAERPDGTVTVYLNAPGSHGARLLDVYQRWS
ncbi:hypothetical protein NDR87_25930 [Nocardia sp. CDC159]|uniref:Uncharacterized protein n=1 Tax=Nocardia pulmonis TaxID=2951408 RepID=A0A9X2EAP6_9NOCA|nr:MULTISPECIES: hypothetical protein [Nocardia]MCM6774886.1 hypothetical protein [Nocardia pulmonis]MCM6789817.1 hypothetical protein [Nocardia sp. CDC159]